MQLTELLPTLIIDQAMITLVATAVDAPSSRHIECYAVRVTLSEPRSGLSRARTGLQAGIAPTSPSVNGVQVSLVYEWGVSIHLSASACDVECGKARTSRSEPGV
jgi:hypothetical protein